MLPCRLFTGGATDTVKDAEAPRDSAVHVIVPEPNPTAVALDPLTVTAAVFVLENTGEMQARVVPSLRVTVHVRPVTEPCSRLSGFGVIAIDNGVAVPAVMVTFPVPAAAKAATPPESAVTAPGVPAPVTT